MKMVFRRHSFYHNVKTCSSRAIKLLIAASLAVCTPAYSNENKATPADPADGRNFDSNNIAASYGGVDFALIDQANISPSTLDFSDYDGIVHFSMPISSVSYEGEPVDAVVDFFAIPLPPIEANSEAEAIEQASGVRNILMGSVLPQIEEYLNSRSQPGTVASTPSEPMPKFQLGPSSLKVLDLWVNSPVGKVLRRDELKESRNFIVRMYDRLRGKKADPVTPAPTISELYEAERARISPDTGTQNQVYFLAAVRAGGHIGSQTQILNASVEAAITAGLISSVFGVLYELIGRFVMYQGWIPQFIRQGFLDGREKLNRLLQKPTLSSREASDLERLMKASESFTVMETSKLETAQDGRTKVVKKTSAVSTVLDFLGRQVWLQTPGSGGNRLPAKLASLLEGSFKLLVLEIAVLYGFVSAQEGLLYIAHSPNPTMAIVSLVGAAALAVLFQGMADMWNYTRSIFKDIPRIFRTVIPEGRDEGEYRKALLDGHRFMLIFRGVLISVVAMTLATIIAKGDGHGGAIDNVSSIALMTVSGITMGLLAMRVKHGSFVNFFHKSTEGFKTMFSKKSASRLTDSQYINYLSNEHPEADILLKDERFARYVQESRYNFMVPSSRGSSSCSDNFLSVDRRTLE